MAQQIINIGTAPDDGTGDQLRDAFDKVNDNFSEVYSDIAAINATPDIDDILTAGSTATIAIKANAGISTTVGNLALSSAGGVIQANGHTITAQALETSVVRTPVIQYPGILTMSGGDLGGLQQVTLENISDGNLVIRSAGAGATVISAAPSYISVPKNSQIVVHGHNGVNITSLNSAETLINYSTGSGDLRIGHTNGHVTHFYGNTTGINYNDLENIPGGVGTIADLGDLTDVTLSNPIIGQVLKYNGANWVNSTDATGGGGGGGAGLTTRINAAATTSIIATGVTEDATITGFTGYALYKIATTGASWVRVYASTAARTADAGRSQNVDPAPDAGVIAEIITTGADDVLISPGAIGFSNETTPSTDIQIAVTNLDPSSQAITVTLTILQLEV